MPARRLVTHVLLVLQECVAVYDNRVDVMISLSIRFTYCVRYSTRTTAALTQIVLPAVFLARLNAESDSSTFVQLSNPSVARCSDAA